MEIREIMDLLFFITSIFCIFMLGFKISNLKFKVGYYEQKFKNHKAKFTEEEWKKIQEMIDTKNPIFKR